MLGTAHLSSSVALVMLKELSILEKGEMDEWTAALLHLERAMNNTIVLLTFQLQLFRILEAVRGCEKTHHYALFSNVFF